MFDVGVKHMASIQLFHTEWDLRMLLYGLQFQAITPPTPRSLPDHVALDEEDDIDLRPNLDEACDDNDDIDDGVEHVPCHCHACGAIEGELGPCCTDASRAGSAVLLFGKGYDLICFVVWKTLIFYLSWQDRC